MAHQQESFLPFSSQQSLSCCLSRVAKRSTPKPRGPLYSPSELCGTSIYFRTAWSTLYFGAAWSTLFSPKTLWSSLSLHQNHVDLYLSTSEPHGSLPFPSEPRGSLSMAAAPRFKSQCPSSFAASFLTPPTISYTCQHPCILPALLGCQRKSGQVWPHGMEPIISKLSRRPCNQGELLPSPILGGIHSHPPGSKHGHRYFTHP